MVTYARQSRTTKTENKSTAAYEVYSKSNGTVHAARTTFIAEKKSIAFCDVTMSYGF